MSTVLRLAVHCALVAAMLLILEWIYSTGPVTPANRQGEILVGMMWNGVVTLALWADRVSGG